MLRTIVVPLDHSDEAEAAVPHGDDVVDTGYVYGLAARLADQGVKAEWETAHDRDAAEAIVRFAEAHQPGLIALTTHGRSGLGRVALGGVAFQVARRATCPVLVLRPASDHTG